MRSVLALVLSLMLAATSLSMAVARGQVMQGRTVLLCNGTGLTPVLLDASGKPMGPRHICPDCALALFAAAVPVAALPSPPAGVRRLHVVPGAEEGAAQAAPVPRSRGPPVPV